MELLIHQYMFMMLDAENNLTVPSKAVIKLNDAERGFLETRIRRMFEKNRRSIELTSNEKSNTLLKQYHPEHFEETAQIIASQYFDWKMHSGKHEYSDLFFIEVRIDEIEYFAALDIVLKTQYSHQTVYELNAPVNHLMQYRSILSSAPSKEDCSFFYDWRNQRLYIHENKIEVEGIKQGFFKDVLFDVSAYPTEKELLSVMEKTVKEVSRKYEMDLLETLPELKSAVSSTEMIEVDAVAKAVFEKLPSAKEEFRIKVENEGIKEAIPFDQNKLPKKDRTMKFVTETGIEIIIPASYLKRKDKVEIINNPDGTTSIAIKNIEKLKNR